MSVSTTPNLTGQVAIVTGGESGIGRAIALALAAAGACVAVVDRNSGDAVAAIEAAGGRAVAKTVDVTDRHAVEEMVHAVEKQFGDITLLVNNAGIAAESLGPSWEVDPDWWWRTIDVNLRGQFLCARAVLPGMVRRRQGRIMNMTGGGSYGGNIPGLSAYSASKAGIARFSSCLADETREYGIPVFVIHPRLVRTPLTEAVATSDRGQPVSRNMTASFQDMEGSTQKGEVEPPEVIARMVVQLASGKADALSGRYIGTWDDLDELIRRADEITRDDLYTLQRPGLRHESTPA